MSRIFLFETQLSRNFIPAIAQIIDRYRIGNIYFHFVEDKYLKKFASGKLNSYPSIMGYWWNEKEKQSNISTQILILFVPKNYLYSYFCKLYMLSNKIICSYYLLWQGVCWIYLILINKYSIMKITYIYKWNMSVQKLWRHLVYLKS